MPEEMKSVTLEHLAHLNEQFPSRPYALRGNVWDGDAKEATPGMVIVKGDELLYVGASDTAPALPDLPVAEVSGTILPGLIDLHVHARPHYLPWFLRAGVTALRDANNSLTVRAHLLAAQGAPRMALSGPLLDGPDSIFKHFGEENLYRPGKDNFQDASACIVTTPQQARDTLQMLAAQGVQHIKLYEQLAPEVYDAAVSAAHSLGLPVMTDMGMRITRGLSGAQVDARQALRAGVTSIEHVSGYALAYQRLGGDLDAPELKEGLLDELADLTVQAGTALVPTLMVFAPLTQCEPIRDNDLPNAGIQDSTRASLEAQWQQVHAVMKDRHLPASDLRLATELIRRVAQREGLIGVGTDTPAGAFNAPGDAVHQELALLVQAGLTPRQALMGATSTAAQIMGRPDLGRLHSGQRADVLIVNGDPLKDIRHIRNISAVIQQGKWQGTRVLAH